MSRKAKRMKENNQKKKKILIFVELILVVVMIYSGIKIVLWFIDNNKTKEVIKEISNYVQVDENKDEFNIDFQELKKINSDVVGWIKVKGTSIEYPVVQGKDNEFYLTHSFDKSENQAGWAFMDYRNDKNLTDKNTIIYGHNRRDGSMFESLKHILDEDWQNDMNNRKIVLVTEKGKILYEVFSVYKIEAEEYYIQPNPKDFEEFLNELKKRSVKDFNVETSKNDQILTLSTCDDNSEYRIILHAKKIQKEQK